LRFVEADPTAAVGLEGNVAGHRLVTVADLAAGFEGRCLLRDEPAQFLRQQASGQDMLLLAHHHPVGGGINGGYIQRFAPADPEPLALADGIAMGALVAAQNGAVDMDDLPGLRRDPMAFKKRDVVVAGDEADLLAIPFCATARPNCSASRRT